MFFPSCEIAVASCGFSVGVSLCSTRDNLGPAACGVVRPRIVLPQILLDRLSREELRFVLLHELVHVRRHDVLVDQLTGLVTIVHWFHPVAWISRYFLRRERELACDAAVLELSRGANAVEYGHVILKTIESLAAPLAPFPGLVGMFSRRPLSLVHRRIRLIAAYRRSTWASPLLGGSVLFALMLVGLTDAQTKQHRRICPIAAYRSTWASPLMGGSVLFALMLVGLTDAQTKQKQADPAQKPTASPEQSRPAAKTTTAKDAAEKTEESTYSVPITVTPRIRHHPLTVTGKAMDQNGKPIAGATIVLAAVNNSPGKVLGETMTDRDGRYEFRNAKLPYYVPEKQDSYEHGTFQVFGKAPGLGFAWRGMRFLHIDPRFIDENGKSLIGSPSYGYFPGEAIDLDLAFSPAKPIRGRIVDDQGRPIRDVKVSLTDCDYCDTTGKEAKASFRELRDVVEKAGRAAPRSGKGMRLGCRGAIRIEVGARGNRVSAGDGASRLRVLGDLHGNCGFTSQEIRRHRRAAIADRDDTAKNEIHLRTGPLRGYARALRRCTRRRLFATGHQQCLGKFGQTGPRCAEAASR